MQGREACEGEARLRAHALYNEVIDPVSDDALTHLVARKSLRVAADDRAVRVRTRMEVHELFLEARQCVECADELQLELGQEHRRWASARMRRCRGVSALCLRRALAVLQRGSGARGISRDERSFGRDTCGGGVVGGVSGQGDWDAAGPVEHLRHRVLHAALEPCDDVHEAIDGGIFFLEEPEALARCERGQRQTCEDEG